MLHRLETRLIGNHVPPKLVFIVGAPRSGTTLLFQLITESFDLGYTSNWHSQYFGGISIVERLVRPLRNRPPADFRSVHGRTDGRTAPNECGEYWYQFFRRSPVFTPLTDFAPRQSRMLEASCTRIYQAFGKPVVFKNVMNSARLQVLGSLFPEAVFLHCERNIVDNAHSIIEAKQKALGCIDKPWSLQPDGYARFAASAPEIQAIQQVKLCSEMISRDLRTTNAVNYLNVKYESLCSVPREELDRIENFLVNSLGSVERRPQAQIPERFEVRREVRIPQNVYERLVLAEI